MLAKVFSLFSTIKNKTIKKRLKKSKWFFLDKEAIHLSEHQINFRGKNGENYFHDLARKKPIMFIEKLPSVNRLSRLFSKLPRLESFFANSSIKTIINLMDAPDNEGRYPLEYFLCYVTEDHIEYCRDSANIFDIQSPINSQWVRRPDWLEVKMLIAENNQNLSHVDFFPVIWKQKAKEDFRRCIETDRGKELIRMAANDFSYRRGSSSIFCGMGIKEYTHDRYSANIFDDIDIENKDEVKLYLMQSWRLLNAWFALPDNPKFIPKVEFFTLKAIELGIDVIKMREQFIHSCSGDKKRLNKCLKIMSKYNFWNSLDAIYERSLMMQVVSLENRQAAAQISLAL